MFLNFCRIIRRLFDFLQWCYQTFWDAFYLVDNWRTVFALTKLKICAVSEGRLVQLVVYMTANCWALGSSSSWVIYFRHTSHHCCVGFVSTHTGESYAKFSCSWRVNVKLILDTEANVALDPWNRGHGSSLSKSWDLVYKVENCSGKVNFGWILSKLFSTDGTTCGATFNRFYK